MDGPSGTYGERYIERIDGNAEEQRALGRLRFRWGNNIEMDL